MPFYKYDKYSNTDSSGNDIEHGWDAENKRTKKECQQRCDENQDCKVWMWGKKNGDSSHTGCWIKDGLNGSSIGADNRFDSYVKRTDRGYTKYENTDSGGADIGTQGTADSQHGWDDQNKVTKQECRRRCSARDDCKVWMWGKKTDDETYQGCWLKTELNASGQGNDPRFDTFHKNTSDLSQNGFLVSTKDFTPYTEELGTTALSTLPNSAYDGTDGYHAWCLLHSSRDYNLRANEWCTTSEAKSACANQCPS